MKQIEKALARVKRLVKEELNGVTSAYIHDDGLLYLEFDNGMNFSLSEKEVKFQADEYDFEGVSPLDFYSRMVNESDYNPKLIEYYCNNFMERAKDYDTNLNEFIEWVKLDTMKLSIDGESVHIYLDHGDDVDPTSILYWHLDEVEVDNSVSLSIANAIDLFHTNKEELLNKVCSIKILNSY